jgi:Fe-S cluster assembly protein SufD
MTLASFIERSRREPENWRYTNLEKILASRSALTSSSPAFNGEPAETPRLVFVNGVFHAKKSHFGSVPSCILMGDLESGYALTLGEKTCLVAQPIELSFVTDHEAPKEIALKFEIEIGRSGRLTLLSNHAASDVPTTVETDIIMHPHAKFLFGKIVAGGVHLARHTVRAAEGCYYGNVALIRGGSLIRNEMDVRLEGEEAQASLNAIMLLRDGEHADTTSIITHQAPRCTSRQVCKTILDGNARGVFQGKIAVAKGAQKSDGYQLSRALLLSDKAEMDAKPELEIFADDVKCSHGSTIGDLDENAMFYLRSRGLSGEQARALLIEGFVAETLEEIQVPEWRDIFRREVEAWTR